MEKTHSKKHRAALNQLTKQNPTPDISDHKSHINILVIQSNLGALDRYHVQYAQHTDESHQSASHCTEVGWPALCYELKHSQELVGTVLTLNVYALCRLGAAQDLNNAAQV